MSGSCTLLDYPAFSSGLIQRSGSDARGIKLPVNWGNGTIPDQRRGVYHFSPLCKLPHQSLAGDVLSGINLISQLSKSWSPSHS